MLFATDKPPTFDLGLVPGVFLGSFLAAALFGELKLEGFPGGASMRRYIARRHAAWASAACWPAAARSAPGLSGAAVFTITSWVTLCAMWAAAAMTDRLVDQRRSRHARPGHAGHRRRPALAPDRDEPTRRPHAIRLGTLATAALLAVHAAAAQADRWRRAEEIVQGKCFICHGADGESSSPVFPRLAGQHAGYVARQLADYKSRQAQEQHHAADGRGPVARRLQGAGRVFRGAQAAGTRGRRPRTGPDGALHLPARQPVLRRGRLRTCHGANGDGTETLPRLAGQHAQYTENQLKAFNKRERTNDNAVMHGIAGKLTELELKAVAAYISGLK